MLIILKIYSLYLHRFLLNKQFTIMSTLNNLVVKVERSTCDPRNPFKILFEVQCNIDNSISVPFESLTNSLRFLFGSECVISFSSRLTLLKNK